MTFASVKGAGHMVARDKRAAAYVLLDSFLYRENLPEKDESEWFKTSLKYIDGIDWLAIILSIFNNEMLNDRS